MGNSRLAREGGSRVEKYCMECERRRRKPEQSIGEPTKKAVSARCNKIERDEGLAGWDSGAILSGSS